MMRALSAVISLALLSPVVTQAGPPFQTDDPEPIAYGHYEFYVFGSADGTPIETDTAGPAVEFNWGALPNLHLHIVIPATAVFPAGDEPREFGLGDIELGAKYRFVQETRHRPMIGTFPMFEAPTGNPNRGLGVGKGWAKLPIWLQKSFGPWTTYGGVGENVNNAPGFRNCTYGGWLLQRDIGKRLTLGAEVFSHGGEGPGTPQPRSATMVDLGGYYYFRKPAFQLLFCYGHTAAGGTENYAYLGLYWTWGGKADKTAASFSALEPHL